MYSFPSVLHRSPSFRTFPVCSFQLVSSRGLLLKFEGSVGERIMTVSVPGDSPSELPRTQFVSWPADSLSITETKENFQGVQITSTSDLQRYGLKVFVAPVGSWPAIKSLLERLKPSASSSVQIYAWRAVLLIRSNE